MIVDVNGNPIRTGELAEPQTAKVGTLQNEFANHPSRGLTPVKLARILQDAEQGDILAQCDLFEDMEEKDAHIFSEISKRRRAPLSIPWDIEPPPGATAKEKRDAEAVKEMMECLELEDILFEMADAVGKAFACLEIEWGRTGNTWLPKSIAQRPQRWFRIRANTDDIRLRDNSPEGAELQPFGWIVHEHKARSGWLPRAGLHRVLAWPYLFKNYSVRDLAEFLEIYGLPLRLGTYPRGATETEKRTLLRAVLGIGHDAAGIVPEGMAIDFKEAAKGQKDPFEFMIEWCERSQSKAIVGATLTSQTDGGSGAYALGNVHLEVMRDLVLSDCRQIKGTLTRHLVYPLAALNLAGIEPDRSPRFVFDTHEPEDIKLFSEALPPLVQVGMRIPETWAREKLGIPEPADDEPLLAQGAGAPVPSPGEAPPGPPEPPPPGTGAARQSLAQAIIAAREQRAALDLADELADRLEDESELALDAMVESIRRLVESVDSLEALRDGLDTMFPDIDDTVLAEILRDALLAATLGGRFELDQGR